MSEFIRLVLDAQNIFKHRAICWKSIYLHENCLQFRNSRQKAASFLVFFIRRFLITRR